MSNISSGSKKALKEHETMRKALLVCGVSLLMACCTFAASAQQQQPAPDNTKANQGDANKNATTADQQKMNIR